MIHCKYFGSFIHCNSLERMVSSSFNIESKRTGIDSLFSLGKSKLRQSRGCIFLWHYDTFWWQAHTYIIFVYLNARYEQYNKKYINHRYRVYYCINQQCVCILVIYDYYAPRSTSIYFIGISKKIEYTF